MKRKPAPESTGVCQESLFLIEDEPVDHFERMFAARGFQAVAGIDEAGRGPLAGPVVAAAVILDHSCPIEGLNDSKKLTPAQRDALFPLIRERARAIGVGIVDATEIDQINILQATRKAMLLACERLRCPADVLLIDGITKIDSSLHQLCIKQGDSRSISISAASIIAKVVRDRMMEGYERRYPGYGLAGHKGYGTAAHRAAIAALGPSPIHRLSFGGVREYVREENR